MSGLGTMMAGGGGQGRQQDDYYPTPPDVTQALLTAWRPRSSWVSEPACGAGHLARVFEDAGYRVDGSDINPRGYGHREDFLTSGAVGVPALVTNPPWDRAEEFIAHALALDVAEIAMLLKATYWHTLGRLPLFDRRPPTMILPLTWRPDFRGLGNPVVDVMWCVWQEPTAPQIYRPLPRPAGRWSA